MKELHDAEKVRVFLPAVAERVLKIIKTQDRFLDCT